MTTDQKIAVLKQIIDTGSCAITPPVMGWLIETGIMTDKGFDTERAEAELKALTA